MIDGAEVQRSVAGAWRLMTGKSDGLKLLDLSADGFWNSFFAIGVALPALIVGWVSIAGDVGAEVTTGEKLWTVLRLGIVDIGAWVLPLVGLALVARRAGLAPRFVHYVVASNWGSVVTVWLMLPAALFGIVLPDAADLAGLFSLLLFGVSMALTWRLTVLAIDRGPALGSAVFAGMFAASLAVLFALQALLGVSPSG